MEPVKVKLNREYRVHATGKLHRKGEIVEVTEREAKSLEAWGYAKRIKRGRTPANKMVTETYDK